MRPSNELFQSITNGSRHVQRVCGASGLTQQAILGKIRNLTSLIASLDQSIREAERAESDEQTFGRIITVLELVVVGCNLFMEIAEAAGPAGKIIKVIYAQKDTLADATVGKFDAAMVTTRALDGAAEFVPGVGQPLLRMGTRTANAGIEAARNEMTTRKIAQYGLAKNAELLAWALETEGKSKGARVVTRGMAVINASISVLEMFETAKEPSGIASANRTAIEMSRRMKRDLVLLNADLEACGELLA